MVTVPGPRESGGEAPPLEWRRYFYDRVDGSSIAVASIMVIVAAVLLYGAVHSATDPHVHPSVVATWCSGVAISAGAALAYFLLSGAVPVRRNRVTFHAGAHSCTGPRPIYWVGTALLVLGTIALGISAITADAVGAAPMADSRRYPTFVIAIIALIGLTFWQLSFGKLGDRLEFSPDGLTSEVGSWRVEVPWDSILDARVYTGPSRSRPLGLGRRTEIWLTTTCDVEHPGAESRAGTRSFAVDLGRFSVDEDTLYNVIVAARAHPQVRQLLGREEGDVLFEGPPRDTRRALNRAQVWLPWEREIVAALGDSDGGALRARVAGQATSPARRGGDR